jgi:hypothetical protein
MTYGDLSEAMSRSQVQASIALVFKVWIPQLLGVVLDDALDEWEVV